MKDFTRRFGGSAAAWAFGFAMSVLLISVWGRAVVIDSAGLSESLTPLSQSLTVTDQVENWLVAELEESGIDPAVSSGAIDQMLASSVVDEVLEDLVGEVVAAAASPDPQQAIVDVAAVLEPAIPELAFNLQAAGVAVGQAEVEQMVEGLEPLVIRPPDSGPAVGPQSKVVARLGTASVLALLAMALTGWAVVAISDDRWGELRRLGNRVAISGLSFALMLRIGSWVLDPAGGRAPLARTLSSLAASKWATPLMVAGVAAAVAASAWSRGRYLRPVAASPSGSEPPTREEELLPL